MNSLPQLSEALYNGLCVIVGTHEEVSIRRDIADVPEMIGNPFSRSTLAVTMKAGSSREGFRMAGSDVDVMMWPNDHKVLFDLSQAKYYRNRGHLTQILTEDEGTPPGFVLLHLLSFSSHILLMSSCIVVNGKLYISSNKYRQNICAIMRYPNSSIHGPCDNFNLNGMEYDVAHCFACDFWPPLAYPWIHRSQTWPSKSVCQDIVKNGCHFVAIGSRKFLHNDKEWRVSFSLAEQKLVYSMNHSQFLVYGLLKLFLNEVINHGVQDKILCSYFMKTAVFWQIHYHTNISWCPQNLLRCFWLCFKHVIQWVYKGVCPNFFIPENNMFLGKVEGQTQKYLFLQLRVLYEKGLFCLLQCKSIRSCLIDALYHPTRDANLSLNVMLKEIRRDKNVWFEIYWNQMVPHRDVNFSLIYLKMLQKVELLMQRPLTQHQHLFLQNIKTKILHHTAFYLQSMYSGSGSNKIIYMADKMSCHMLKTAVKSGEISNMLYLAMYYYRTFRFTEACHVIERAKSKLAQSYLNYLPLQLVHIKTCHKAVKEKSWFKKFKETVSNTVEFQRNVSYIKELELEQNSRYKNPYCTLNIPPFVLLHMLSVLCYSHTDTTKRQHSLNDLYVLLYYGDSKYASKRRSDISWQILGICQEMCLDWKGAMYSYQESLRQHPFNSIQTATYIRMKHAMTKLASA